MQDIPNNNFVDDDNKNDEIVHIFDRRKYEQAARECKKLWNSIKTVVGKNIKVLSEKEYDRVRAEYGKKLILLKCQTVMIQ